MTNRTAAEVIDAARDLTADAGMSRVAAVLERVAAGENVAPSELVEARAADELAEMAAERERALADKAARAARRERIGVDMLELWTAIDTVTDRAEAAYNAMMSAHAELCVAAEGLRAAELAVRQYVAHNHVTDDERPARPAGVGVADVDSMGSTRFSVDGPDGGKRQLLWPIGEGYFRWVKNRRAESMPTQATAADPQDPQNPANRLPKRVPDQALSAK